MSESLGDPSFVIEIEVYGGLIFDDTESGSDAETVQLQAYLGAVCARLNEFVEDRKLHGVIDDGTMNFRDRISSDGDLYAAILFGVGSLERTVAVDVMRAFNALIANEGRGDNDDLLRSRLLGDAYALWGKIDPDHSGL